MKASLGFTLFVRRAWALRLAGSLISLPAAFGGEAYPENSRFDSGAAGWTWENWSAPGSSVAFVATENSAVRDGAVKSGALKLRSAFTATEAYQQAVYTMPLTAPANFAGQVGSVSFDVKVDAASNSRAEGDFGLLEVVLRQGGNWDWVTLPGVRLNGNSWQRVSFPVPKSGVDSIRALTLKLGDGALTGPVTLYVDNLAYRTTPDDLLISGLDGGIESEPVTGWTWENWSAPGVASFSALDVQGRSTSGSIQLEHNFDNKPGDYQQTVFTYVLPGGRVDAATEYSQVNLDVKVSSNSVPRAGGDYGFFEVILRNGDGWDWLATEINGASGIALQGNDWQRLSFKIPKTASAVHRLTFKVGQNALLGPVVLNLDNLTFTRNTAPPPAPALTLEPAQSGLSLVTTSTDQYGRHNLFTTDDEAEPGRLAFSGVTQPVSYSWTLASFPDVAKYPGFQAHIFLVQGTPGAASSPDWNEPTLIFIDIKAGAGNSGNATFRLKTDQPNGNSELYAANRAVVNSASVVGTWTVTVNGRMITMTAPDGTVGEPIDIGDEAAAAFAGTDGPRLRAYFGVQPNADANKGQSVRVARIQIKRGNTILISDDFAGAELDVARWTANATAGGVLFVPPGEAGYIARWTLPDNGFVLQSAGGLSVPDWKNVEATPVSVGQLRQAIVPKSAFPVGSQAFLRLFKATQE